MCKDTGVRPASLYTLCSCFALLYSAIAIHFDRAPGPRNGIDELVLWVIALLMGSLYWAGFQAVRRSPPVSVRRILAWAFPLVLICFVTIPYDSTDVFLYMNVGWEQAHYGLNPYTHTLRDIPAIGPDPIVRAEWMQSNKNPWLDLPFVYGFTFAWIVRIVASFGHGNWWLTLALLKSLNVAAYLVTAWLLGSMLSAFGFARPDVGVYLFAWSPLILQHHIANAHNDILVGCLVIGSFYLLFGRGDMLAPSVMILATLIKYATLPLVPVTFWFIWRRKGWPRAALAAVSAAVITAAVSAPYMMDLSQFRFDLIQSQLNKVTAGSFYAFLYYLYRLILPGTLSTFGFILKIALWVFAGTLLLAQYVVLWQKEHPAFSDVIRASAMIMFVVIFVASSQFYSWYIAMLFPLALLLPPA